jgi:hypothetical protein
MEKFIDASGSIFLHTNRSLMVHSNRLKKYSLEIELEYFEDL